MKIKSVLKTSTKTMNKIYMKRITKVRIVKTFLKPVKYINLLTAYIMVANIMIKMNQIQELQTTIIFQKFASLILKSSIPLQNNCISCSHLSLKKPLYWRYISILIVRHIKILIKVFRRIMSRSALINMQDLLLQKQISYKLFETITSYKFHKH